MAAEQDNGGNSQALAPRIWGAVAADMVAWTGPEVERLFTAAGYPPGTLFWRLVRTAGYFQRGMPMIFEAIGPTPLPGVFWRGEKVQPAAKSDRWHGFRYMGVGVVVPLDYLWPPGAPWKRVYSPEGQVFENRCS